MRTTYKIVSSMEEIDTLIDYCKQTGYACFDFETNCTQVHEDYFYPTAVSIAFQPGSAWVIPLGHKHSVFKLFYRKVLRKLAIGIFENPTITKIAWNAVFDGRIIRKYGYRVRGRYFDGMLAKYILNEERPSDLKSMVDWFLPDFSGYDLPNKPGRNASIENIRAFWENVNLEDLCKYCAGDADFTFRLFLHFESKLLSTKLYKFLRNFYGPLTRILTDTILQGVLVDRLYLSNLEIDYQNLINEQEKKLRAIDEVENFNEAQIEERIRDYIADIEYQIDHGGLTDRQIATREEKISQIEAGEATTKKEEKLFEDINFASVNQMVQLLYESDDGFEFPILARTDTGNPSTDESTLLKLKAYDDSGFIETLLELRGLQVLFSTFVKGIYREHLSSKDRVHPGYLLHGTVSGRLSSRSPNFQNIPRATTAAPIKKMFIAPKDHYFVEVDLSQAELRTAAEMYKDQAMIKIFKEDKNIHVATAALVFEVDYDVINKARKDATHPQHIEMVKKHKAAKVLNFTIFYGAGPKKVAEFITESTKEKHSTQQAQEFIDQWFETFPEAAKGIKRTQKNAIRDGFSTNMFGRKRRLPILLDPRNKEREKGKWNEALRQAVNAPIQAMSSDITQWINICVYIDILEGRLPSYLRLVSTVHDSLEFYVHKEDVPQVVSRILELAQALPNLKAYMGNELKQVPMKASAELGINWGIMNPYDPNKDYILTYEQEWKAYNETEKLPHISYT